MNEVSPKLHAAAMVMYATLEHIPRHILYRQLHEFALEQKHLGNEQAYHEVMFIYWATIKTN